VLLLLGLMAVFPIQSDDVFMYLAIGRRAAHDGRLPTIDPFLFSIPDYHWHILHEWGAHRLAYALYVAGGWTALIAGKTALLLAMAATPLLLARRLRTHSAIVPLVILLAVLAGAHRLIERSSLLSDFLTAAVLGIVLADRVRVGWARWLLPVIFLGWVNLHPGFLVGLAVCGLAVVTDWRRWRQPATRAFAAIVGLSVLACLANPMGISGVLYPLRPYFDPAWEANRQYNFEWMSTLSSVYVQSLGARALFSLAAISVGLCLWRRGRRPWFEAAALGLLLWLGLSAARFMITAAFGMAVIATSLAARREAVPARRAMSRANALTCGLIALVGCAGAFGVAHWDYTVMGAPRHVGLGIDERLHPVRAAEFIERIGLATNLFNQQEYGSYLAWRWDGTRKLFYHGFVEDLDFYQRDYLSVNVSREAFNRIVDRYEIGAFLISRPPPAPQSRWPLLHQILLASPEWRLVYADDLRILVLRETPANKDALARCPPLRLFSGT
jgi:hypothetical protein